MILIGFVRVWNQRVIDHRFIEIVGHLEMDSAFCAFASAALADNDR